MASITIPAAIVGAGVVGGAAINASAASSASNKVKDAANSATALQKTEFDNTTANNKPFLTTGTSALNNIANLYNLDTVDASGNTVKGSGTSTNLDPNATFYQTPDYQFALSQGIKGVDAGAAARGMLDSGATRKAEIAYGGNLASGQFNTYAGRLQQIAGIGQTAANSQANANANYAGTYSNTVTNAADTQAGIQTSGANSTSAALQQLVGGIGKNPFGSSYGTNPVSVTPNQMTGGF